MSAVDRLFGLSANRGGTGSHREVQDVAQGTLWDEENIDGTGGYKKTYYRYGKIRCIDETRYTDTGMVMTMQNAMGRWDVSGGSEENVFVGTYECTPEIDYIVLHAGKDFDVLTCQKRNVDYTSEWRYQLSGGCWKSFPLPDRKKADPRLLYLMAIVERYHLKCPHKSAVLYAIYKIWKQKLLF